MFELSANLEYMFVEAGDDIPSRIAAAANCGIHKVEIFSTEGRDLAAIKSALEYNNTTLWSVVADPKIQIVLPQEHEKFRSAVASAAKAANQLNCPHVVIGSGVGAPFLNRYISLDNAAAAIESAISIAEQYNVTLILEAVNTRVDHPGVFVSSNRDTAYIAAKINHPRVKVLFDIYHCIAEEEDIDITAKQLFSQHLVGHVQIADFPGRGEPGSGDQNWPHIIELLKSHKYLGAIGIECKPTQGTADALSYIKSLVN